MSDDYIYDEKFIFELTEKMSKNLKKKRFVHSIGVAGTAASLAMKYNEDIHKAQVAGILHDCAKGYSDEELYELCKKNKLELFDYDKEYGFSLHARYGAYLAEKKYEISDTYILDAIKWHTTGREDMTLLDKIIYISDYIEPSRCMADNLDELRFIAFNSEDINLPLVRIMENTVNYLENKGSFIDSTTQMAYEYYKGIICI